MRDGPRAIVEGMPERRDETPDERAHESELVDEAGLESFPASDPPALWAGRLDRPAPRDERRPDDAARTVRRAEP